MLLTGVVEDIENQGILDALMKPGCDAAQDYRLSRPLEAARIPDVVQEYIGAARSAA
jgi:EAL domain-containing protein (putative c-di-GMP-specific phosphodiesterase class I)